MFFKGTFFKVGKFFDSLLFCCYVIDVLQRKLSCLMLPETVLIVLKLMLDLLPLLWSTLPFFFSDMLKVFALIQFSDKVSNDRCTGPSHLQISFKPRPTLPFMHRLPLNDQIILRLFNQAHLNLIPCVILLHPHHKIINMRLLDLWRHWCESVVVI